MRLVLCNHQIFHIYLLIVRVCLARIEAHFHRSSCVGDARTVNLPNV